MAETTYTHNDPLPTAAYAHNDSSPTAAYTQEDFLNGTAPFAEVYNCRSNAFEHQRAIERMDKLARSLKVTGFKGMYKNYVKALETDENMLSFSSPTEFSAQPIQLDAGEWTASDSGIYRPTERGMEIACPHPLTVVGRLVNIDTGEEKLTLAWRKGGYWRQQTFPKDVLASSQKIVSLASTGIAVTSETAKALVRYIADLENRNYDYIPEKKSVSRLGFVGEEGFSPYVQGLAFDGDANFSTLFNAVKIKGDYLKWLKTVSEARKQSLAARIIIAASFASPLISIVGGLPFFVHLWGTSGGGKTVGLMIAASVWGNPEPGKYIVTFNSTSVGLEKTCAFLNNLPMCIDELQLARDSKGRVNFDVYKLAQGVGKTRGNRTGGIDRAPTWANCILSTGESPITPSQESAGAVNRVIEIAATDEQFVIADGYGRDFATVVRENYGWGGRAFIAFFNQQDQAEIKEEYSEILSELLKTDTTEKQASSAALIVLADRLAQRWIFQDDGEAITISDMTEFLKTKQEVSVGVRGYEYIMGWLSMNAMHFKKADEQPIGEVYGTIENGYACIVRSKFNDVTEEAGISSAALLRYLKSEGLILVRGRAFTKSRRINGIMTECVCLKLPSSKSPSDDFPLF